MDITEKQKRILEILTTAKTDTEAEEQMFQEFGERAIVDKDLGTRLGAKGKSEPIKEIPTNQKDGKF